MGIVIENATVLWGEIETHGSIKGAANAGRKCIEQYDGNRISTVINIGVYRDSNIVEPALAALVQKHLGLGLRYSPEREPVFSFDIVNGPCGFLSAVDTAAALLAGTSRQCLVVAGDGHPAKDADREFPYAQAGAAALLDYTNAPVGFGKVFTGSGTETPTPHGFVDLPAMGRIGREIIQFAPAHPSEDEIVKTALVVAGECLDYEQVSRDEIALVATQPFEGLAQYVADELGVADVYAAPAGAGKDPHTAAPIAAYSSATENASPGSNLLFLAAGAGPVAAASLYRPQPRSARRVEAR